MQHLNLTTSLTAKTINEPNSYCPHLAVTMGDPGGIGAEVILKALADPSITESCRLTVFGTRSILHNTYQVLQTTGESLADPESLSVVDIPLDRTTLSQITLGHGNQASGRASFAYLETATDRTLKGEFQGIVTAPIAKSCWKAAGHDYPGQTEILAQKAGVEKFGMLFIAQSPYTGWTLRTILATTHIPLCQVFATLTPELMTLKLELLINCLQQDFAIKNPKIVISGLNPHSGEQGQLGTEEKDWLFSWLETQQKQRKDVELVGLMPPDTMWVKPGKAWYGNQLELMQTNNTLSNRSILTMTDLGDGYLALYHDQGLIPVKLMAFDQAINTTVGLPFIRTSPDHGTAFDIAGKGIAKATSMKTAIKLASKLAYFRFTKR
ncbi:MAG: 4-hydroxythreonine-4-phosphate dehydrogenase PdxA [cyanobacterium endosymbiont of Rhopalodia musculus]|uniref:4-hydroxythreonine-4-phosphate dehydrogenase PdxA n=1 Tax=cyanobacterium endosymbiont of Epithemia clementina EcSB TaxID=3034674 RepID=UPI002480F80F|nr:4-hydroxythreonine-4-phosphate dehydrogenase PdxA [cyanobacterium endosymbiont of Epithemia clementina EcSB]WGT67187.1 4-hydroxythreonine-4-phosphate dehydrogenase PdxA [cyanobacterium endosymbiont of Epithemia clementina EcSB]